MADRVKRQRGANVDPKIIELAENEIAIKFMEHPELETEIKSKVSELIEHRGGRQVIETRDALLYLKKNLGADLASILCSIESESFKLFSRAKNPGRPTPIQSHNIAAAYIVTDVLLSQIPRTSAIDWLTAYSDYLYGIPAVEIHRRPEDVRMAALNRVMGGEEPLATLF